MKKIQESQLSYDYERRLKKSRLSPTINTGVGWSSPLIVCCRHGQHGERGTVSGSGQAGNMRENHSQDKPAGPFTWNFRLDSSKVTELEVGMMREVVRPWLEMTNTGTGGHRGKTVFTLTAQTLGRLAIGTTSLSH